MLRALRNRCVCSQGQGSSDACFSIDLRVAIYCVPASCSNSHTECNTRHLPAIASTCVYLSLRTLSDVYIVRNIALLLPIVRYLVIICRLYPKYLAEWTFQRILVLSALGQKAGNASSEKKSKSAKGKDTQIVVK